MTLERARVWRGFGERVTEARRVKRGMDVARGREKPRTGALGERVRGLWERLGSVGQLGFVKCAERSCLATFFTASDAVGKLFSQCQKGIFAASSVQ